MKDLEQALRKIALATGDVEEGVACEGTALESRTFGVRKKNFLFVGPKDVRLKLGKSTAAARKHEGCDVGKLGWVKISRASLPPMATLEKWIRESRAIVCG